LAIVIDGIYYALGLCAAGGIVAWLAGPWYSAPLWIVAGYCLYFFRDPERVIPDGPVAVSPADGKVVAVKAESPTLTRISIFLNIFNVHVNRAPSREPSPARSTGRAPSTWPAAKSAPIGTSRTW